MSTELTTTCRRCSDCRKSEHHWYDFFGGDGGPDDFSVACKHCDAKGIECPACEGGGEIDRGDGIVTDECRICRGHGVLFVRFERTGDE